MFKILRYLTIIILKRIGQIIIYSMWVILPRVRILVLREHTYESAWLSCLRIKCVFSHLLGRSSRSRSWVHPSLLPRVPHAGQQAPSLHLRKPCSLRPPLTAFTAPTVVQSTSPSAWISSVADWLVSCLYSGRHPGLSTTQPSGWTSDM